MKSIAQQKFYENDYKQLNAKFPGIEGRFLSHFDAIAVMCELSGIHVKYSYGSVIGIYLSKSAYVTLIFDPYKKRMILNTHGFHDNVITKDIKEKYNISPTLNKRHAGYHGLYEFKYNQKNCKRMLNIIELLVTKDWQKK